MIDVTQERDTLRLHFRDYGLAEYEMFLKAKSLPESEAVFHPDTETYSIETPLRFAALLGVVPPRPPEPDLPLAPFLFDDQAAIVQMALDAKRFAVWSDCGLGKTLIQLEFARQVVERSGGRVLIVTLNEIVNQTIDEAHAFYRDKKGRSWTLDVLRLMSREQMHSWMKDGQKGIAITNYEKFNPGRLKDQVVNECRYLAGVILDESSRLKGGGGKQKWAIIKSSKGVEYKLSCTATPAPNDTIEFASQAAFLEKMRAGGDIIWTYFVRDSKTHRWTVKPHARKAFFNWMSSWSIYVRHPKRYGWRLHLPDVPDPRIELHEIAITAEQEALRQKLTAGPDGSASMFAEDDPQTNAIQRMKLSQLAKGFLYRRGEGGAFDRVHSLKLAYVAGLIAAEIEKGHKIIVWTCFDAEAAILAELLGEAVDFALLTGKTSKRERVAVIDRFKSGKLPALITRAAVLGYGQNLQICTSMIFSGWSDSYESYYQALRRAFRFGQKERLRVHLPVVPGLEDDQLDNIFRKQKEHEDAIAEMESNYLEARGGLI